MVNRKTRRGGARRSNRAAASRRNGGIFRRIYSPVSHLLQATGNAVGTVTNTTRNVAKMGLRGVDSIGLSVTGHANAAVRNLVSRKSRKANRKSRKSSKSSRANRR
jgi:hypothetical protein